MIVWLNISISEEQRVPSEITESERMMINKTVNSIKKNKVQVAVNNNMPIVPETIDSADTDTILNRVKRAVQSAVSTVRRAYGRVVDWYYLHEDAISFTAFIIAVIAVWVYMYGPDAWSWLHSELRLTAEYMVQFTWVGFTHDVSVWSEGIVREAGEWLLNLL